MSWADSSHLSFELLALGRIFFLTPPSGTPSGETFNPALGKSVSAMLERVTTCCLEGKWYEAERWCLAAEQSQNLDGLYRGEMDVEFASAVAEYYHAAALVGLMHWVPAIQRLEKCAESLAFKLPQDAAVVWFALGIVHSFQYDAAKALWVLQKSLGLIRLQTTPHADSIRLLVNAEYKRVLKHGRI